jgi:hypothetical protein
MTRKPANSIAARRFPGGAERLPPAVPRRPFWLPAPNYYLLAAAASAASFFLIWGVLHDGEEASPWIPAAFFAVMLCGASVLLREVVLRRFRRRYVIARQNLDRNLDRSRIPTARDHPRVISVERNAELIGRIKKKSAAAKTLMRLAEGHLEVFGQCTEYLELTDKELKRVPAGSTRLAAIRRGREIAESIRKEHLLVWAEIESKRLTKDAQNRVTIAERIETAQKALDVIVTALDHYPDEGSLIGSNTAILEMIATMRLGHWIELAERASFKGNYARAVSHYKDALFFMARENVSIPDADILAAKLNREIDRLANLPGMRTESHPIVEND